MGWQRRSSSLLWFAGGPSTQRSRARHRRGVRDGRQGTASEGPAECAGWAIASGGRGVRPAGSRQAAAAARPAHHLIETHRDSAASGKVSAAQVTQCWQPSGELDCRRGASCWLLEDDMLSVRRRFRGWGAASGGIEHAGHSKLGRVTPLGVGAPRYRVEQCDRGWKRGVQAAYEVQVGV